MGRLDNMPNQLSPVSVVIIGASGHAKVIADIVRCAGDIVEGFLDDRDAGQFPELRILGHVDDAKQLAFDAKSLRFIIGVGKNAVRESMHKDLGPLPYYTAIHPSAVIASDCSIGEGTSVMANAVINSGSIIGRHCIINTAATVDHDNRINDFVHLSPGVHLAGNVDVGKGTWVGIGSVVSNNVSIHNHCVVGAGAVVINNIIEPGVYVGIPAKNVLKK